jgi:hypothetical protein
MNIITYAAIWSICWFTLGDSDEKGLIILYRGAEFLTTTEYQIRVNDQETASLNSKSFIQIYVKEGQVAVVSSGYRAAKRVLKLSIKASNTYYIRSYEELDFLDKYLRMQVVEEETAKKEMKKCKQNTHVKQPD